MTHIAWVPRRMGGAGARRAGGHGRAASVADDPALPRAARRRQPHRRARVGRALRRCPASTASIVLRGGRADAARHAREGAGEHRRAAAHLRPARVPALARRAAVGRAGARPARRRHRPADRRLDRVGRPARTRTRGSPSSSTATARLRHRVGADVALALASSRRSGPASRTCGRFACTARAAQALLLARLAALAARSRRDRARARARPRGSRASTSTAKPAPFPPGDPPMPSDVLSDELERFTPRPGLRGRSPRRDGVVPELPL